MSLSSLYASRNSCYDQVRYWQGSAAEYSRQIADLTGQLEHKRDQLARAQNVLTEVSALTGKDETVTSELLNLSNAVSVALEESGASSTATQISEENAGHISDAISACNQLIEQLNQEIAQLEAALATAQEGLSYSNGRASYYSQRADHYSYLIATYDED
ncbi:hypothetical protein [Enorma phocaeensis]|uniref:Uncharacterized protein n=1 Tax=Enorma phocaeensis TaxID=1871019 RepID=A0A921IV36_9ACTN|nr:hypothetical protein [Enorma phocaeensis]HJG38136.1 hypothetical protein [Enorma phocaeensis]